MCYLIYREIIIKSICLYSHCSGKITSFYIFCFQTLVTQYICIYIVHNVPWRLGFLNGIVNIHFLRCGCVNEWRHEVIRSKRLEWRESSGTLAFPILKTLFSYLQKMEIAHLQVLWFLLQEQRLGSCPAFPRPTFFFCFHLNVMLFASYPVSLWSLAHKNLLHIPTGDGKHLVWEWSISFLCKTFWHNNIYL